MASTLTPSRPESGLASAFREALSLPRVPGGALILARIRIAGPRPEVPLP